MTKPAILFAATLLSLLLQKTASASVLLDDPSVTATATAKSFQDVIIQDGCTGCANASAVSGSGSASTSINFANTTEVLKASGVISGPDGSYGDAEAQLHYQFAVVGPATSVNIPVWVRSNIVPSGQGSNWSAGGDLGVGGILENIACRSFQGACSPGIPLSSFMNAEGFFPANVAIDVGLRGSVQASGASAQAIVDPYFFIDPAFLAQNPGYSLTFSDGIGNAFIGLPGVPEPAIWTMLILGFGAIGGLLRRARRIEVMGA